MNVNEIADKFDLPRPKGDGVTDDTLAIQRILDVLWGFQAGLRLGAEIAKEHGDCAEACGNTFKPNTKVRAGWEGGELSARQIESAILQELSEDCSPSVSPED